MVEDVGFTVNRRELGADRMLLDAHCAVEESATRSQLAVGAPTTIARGEDPDDPESWVIF